MDTVLIVCDQCFLETIVHEWRKYSASYHYNISDVSASTTTMPATLSEHQWASETYFWNLVLYNPHPAVLTMDDLPTLKMQWSFSLALCAYLDLLQGSHSYQATMCSSMIKYLSWWSLNDLNLAHQLPSLGPGAVQSLTNYKAGSHCIICKLSNWISPRRLSSIT